MVRLSIALAAGFTAALDLTSQPDVPPGATDSFQLVDGTVIPWSDMSTAQRQKYVSWLGRAMSEEQQLIQVYVQRGIDVYAT